MEHKGDAGQARSTDLLKRVVQLLMGHLCQLLSRDPLPGGVPDVSVLCAAHIALTVAREIPHASAAFVAQEPGLLPKTMEVLLNTATMGATAPMRVTAFELLSVYMSVSAPHDPASFVRALDCGLHDLPAVRSRVFVLANKFPLVPTAATSRRGLLDYVKTHVTNMVAAAGSGRGPFNSVSLLAALGSMLLSPSNLDHNVDQIYATLGQCMLGPTFTAPLPHICPNVMAQSSLNFTLWYRLFTIAEGTL